MAFDELDDLLGAVDGAVRENDDLLAELGRVRRQCEGEGLRAATVVVVAAAAVALEMGAARGGGRQLGVGEDAGERLVQARLLHVGLHARYGVRGVRERLVVVGLAVRPQAREHGAEADNVEDAVVRQAAQEERQRVACVIDALLAPHRARAIEQEHELGSLERHALGLRVRDHHAGTGATARRLFLEPRAWRALGECDAHHQRALQRREALGAGCQRHDGRRGGAGFGRAKRDVDRVRRRGDGLDGAREAQRE